MSFLTGLATGIARSADESIKKYLESDNQLKSKLAEKRIARAETEEARFRKEFDGYKREIKQLSKYAGGTDNAQFILEKYGYDAGKALLTDLYGKQLKGGKKVADLFSLQQRTGPSITVDQLATFYTPPIKVGSGASMKGLGGGITKLFGGEDYIQKAVLEQTDAVVGDLTKATLTDIPEALIAIDDLEDYEAGYELNPETEYKRLMGVATNFHSSGNMQKAIKIKISAESNYLTWANQQKSKYSDSELRALYKSNIKDLVGIHNINGAYDNSDNFKAAEDSIEQYRDAMEVASSLSKFAQNAREQGISSVDIKFAITNAITKNQNPIIISPSKDDFFKKSSIQLDTDSKLFTNVDGSIKSNTKNTNPSITSNIQTNQLSSINVTSIVNSIKNLNKSDASLEIIVQQNNLKKLDPTGKKLQELNSALRANGLL